MSRGGPPRRSPSKDSPGHPAFQATVLLIVVTLLILGLAALSTLGHL
jgi:hypothetical protein